MKSTFKPLGVAAAVAAASAGYVNVVNAQDVAVANNNLGDLALVPYYTVKDNWVTGIHIVNTSDRTQVVKFRFRRALDSLDALDFNVIMSPEDVYAGSIRKDENGNVIWSANDSTCTSPPSGPGVALGMPDIYNEDGMGETGYVEIIGMGATVNESQPLARMAVHVGASSSEVGVPRDCIAADRTFEADGTDADDPGVVDGDTAWTPNSTTTGEPGGANTFEDTENVLKVSYFMRNRDNGVEFGDNAVHIQNFLTQSSITNQEFGWLSGDLNGFDFPNLNGSTPVGVSGPGVTNPVTPVATTPPTDYVPQVERFNLLREGTVLGVDSLINEWSANGDNQNTWVVTLPGQYTMFDTPEYVVAYYDDDPATICVPGVCDFRDIPVEVEVAPYDREEYINIVNNPGDTVVSPSIPGEVTRTELRKEVNIVTFAGNSVLGEGDNDVSPALPQPFGWASLTVDPSGDRRVCAWQGVDTEGGARVSDSALAALQTCTIGAPGDVSSADSATGNVPMIGFAAWARQPAGAPAGETYGRIIEHSFTSASTP
jgi:hypothetical protein